MSVTLFLPCAAGVETLLADEVRGLLPAGSTTTAQRGGVTVAGSARDVLALNLESRLAQRVLIEVGGGRTHDEHDLYAFARSVDWARWIAPGQTIRVDVTARRSPLKSLHFAGLRIKDAACDRLRDERGERPSVDTARPDVSIVLHLDVDRATLYVDSSGEPLFKRGWRADKGEAPLKETLAAAMLAAAGWHGTPARGGALHDPCCGSGTIAIEAAQLAMGIAPGLRRRFAFERWPAFLDAGLRAEWQRMKEAAQARVHSSPVPIFASDVSFRMVDFARRNAERAGVAAAISFHGGDALERPAPALPPDLPGTLVVNPPYGERIDVAGKAGPSAPREREDRAAREGGDRAATSEFFARLAAHWKRAYTAHPAGWTAWILSPDPRLPGAMRLKESRRVPLWNGPIECRLFRFDLVAGSARASPPAD